MTLLILGLLLWTGAHLLKRLAPAARAKLSDRMGEASKGLFAGLIVLSVVLMTLGYRWADTPVYWGRTPAMTGINNLLVLLAFYLYAASGMKTRVTRLTRHPQLIGFSLWAVAHLLVNGDLASIVLWGWLLAWAVSEMAIINRQDGPYEPPPPAPARKEVMAVVGGLVVFTIVAGIHTLLGYNPFG